MDESCFRTSPLLDGLIDGELPEERARAVEAHARSCGACRAEIESRRALKTALAKLTLPNPPREARLPRPWARRYIPPSVAAALLVSLAILLLPGSIPPAVALSSRLHDDYLEGRLTPRDLGLETSLPGTDYVGHCPCPPDLGASSPFVVYRKAGVALSLLVVETNAQRVDSSARRYRDGREYFLYKAGRNNVVICQTGKLCHIWVSRLEEADLVATILATREGRALLGGERLSLEGVT